MLRPLERGDAEAWRRVRLRDHDWLVEWDATVPPGETRRARTFADVVRDLRRQGRAGTGLPFVIDVDGEFAGQVSVNNVQRGSAQSASIGYWISREQAGRGIVPQAVGRVIEHLFTAVGLHRVEICVRPENSNSLRVVEKLGLREIGYAPRYLHIAGQWRDHRVFAVTAEEWTGPPHPSHK